MKRSFQLLSLIFLAIICANPSIEALAQNGGKHPRVVELEAKLRESAFHVVRGRFPDAPVLVQATVEPLRRDRSLLGEQTAEELPFLGSVTDDRGDEWDDPTRTLEELLPRVRNARLVITIPSVANDEELAELRDALYAGLGLLPGRDQIDFQRRVWSKRQEAAPEAPFWANWAVYGGIALVFLLIFLTGLGLVARGAANRLARSLGSRGDAAAESPAAAMSPVAMPAAPSASQAAPAPTLAGDLRFNDPLRVREALRETIEGLAADEAFPTLDDLVAIHQRVVNRPGPIGAFFELLPATPRQALFRYGYGKQWLIAYADPGEIDMDAFEFVTRLAAADRSKADPRWQEALIAVWRLDDVLPEFLRSLPQEESFALLAHMPPACSVPAARKAFPGAWGALLDPTYKPAPLAEARCAEIIRRATALKPWSDLALLERFRHERSLLEYLRIADVADEREIYEAAGAQSTLVGVRPPFYPLFRLSPEEMLKVVSQGSLDELALALFNVSRDERRRIEAAMSQKQRYLLIECLRRLDGEQPTKERIGLARETIGNRLALLARRRSAMAAGAARKPATDADNFAPSDDGADDEVGHAA